jgi:hypothetical protein
VNDRKRSRRLGRGNASVVGGASIWFMKPPIVVLSPENAHDRDQWAHCILLTVCSK